MYQVPVWLQLLDTTQKPEERERERETFCHLSNKPKVYEVPPLNNLQEIVVLNFPATQRHKHEHDNNILTNSHVALLFSFFTFKDFHFEVPPY